MSWAAELLVHAIAVEREGARRYADLARRMAECREARAAALFAELARQEEEHLSSLQARSAGLPLPELTSDHSWRERGGPAADALQAEKDARAFFEQAGRVAPDPLARSLAEEMTAEEMEHIARLEALTRG